MAAPDDGFDAMAPENVSRSSCGSAVAESGDVTGRVFEAEGGKVSLATVGATVTWWTRSIAGIRGTPACCREADCFGATADAGLRRMSYEAPTSRQPPSAVPFALGL